MFKSSLYCFTQCSEHQSTFTRHGVAAKPSSKHSHNFFLALGIVHTGDRNWERDITIDGLFGYLMSYFFTEMFLFLPPATKLRQGNIFTSVCLEFCPQGACMAGGHVWWGACIVGGMHSGGHAWQGGRVVGVCMARGMHGGGVHGRGGMHGRKNGNCSRHTHPTGMHWDVWWGVCVARGMHGGGVHGGGWEGMHGRKNGNCSRRYTSYWNAFLLFRFCVCNHWV